MKRPLYIWIAFGLLLAVVLGAMAWVSLAVLRLDRAQFEAQYRAAFEEDVRLALWRMDSGLAPLIARENARPYFAYSAFHPAAGAYTRMFAEITPGDVLMASPLLTELSPYVRAHFQFDPDGVLTSPQIPTGEMRGLAEERYTTHEKIEAATELLREFQTGVDRALLAGLLAEGPVRPTQPVYRQELARAQVVVTDPRQMAQQQEVRNVQEFQARIQSNEAINLPILVPRKTKGVGALSNVTEGVMTPLWVDGSLLLARRVTVNGRAYLQGCLLDWPAITQWLLGDIADLLPAADLEAVTLQSHEGHSRMLASVPARLLPGPVPTGQAHWASPIRTSLLVAWVCVVLAAGAVAVLLSGAVSLSERRGAFVSAVTHELRTPLTTFRMYTEMLAEDMVPEEKRRDYVETLSTQAQRLGHLVENVLAFARLEKNRYSAHTETLTLDELIGRMNRRLSERARQAEMEWVVQLDDAAALRVRVEPAAVEQILFNLVDNACKYAASASDRRIRLTAARAGNSALVKVRDHGPGAAKEGARRLFRAFSKSARDAANSAPGVGLGLALSRRLARSMGGDLRLDADVNDGACFVLVLPSCR